MNLEQTIGQDLNDLWSQNQSPEDSLLGDFYKRGYLAPKNIISNPDLLFIGLNPSYTSGSNGKEEKGGFYKLKKEGNNYQKYFGAFETMAKELGEMTWSHLDLLFIRHTASNDVKHYLSHPFLIEQNSFLKKY